MQIDIALNHKLFNKVFDKTANIFSCKIFKIIVCTSASLLL